MLNFRFYVLVAVLCISLSACSNTSTSDSGLQKADDWSEAVDKLIADGKCKQAVSQLKNEGEKGTQWAYAVLGSLADQGNCIGKDAKQAYHYYEREAENGTCEIQLLLGVRDSAGQGVVKNEARATLRIRTGLLCSASLPPEFRREAIKLLMNYDELPPRISQEISWMETLDKLDPVARLNWAKRLMSGDGIVKGDGVVKNSHRAFMWAMEAANKGVLEAKYVIGKWGLEGKIKSMSEIEGVSFLKTATFGGNIKAHALLGRWYAKSQPTVFRLGRAYMHLKVAQKAGDQSGDQLLKQLAGYLGPIQLFVLEREAQEEFDSRKHR